MASSYSLNFKATLDTDDIQNKLDELKQQQSTLDGINGKISTGGIERKEISLDGVEEQISKITSVIQSLERTIEKLNVDDVDTNRIAKSDGIGSDGDSNNTADDNSILVQLKKQLPKLNDSVENTENLINGKNSTDDVIKELSKTIESLQRTLDRVLQSPNSKSDSQNLHSTAKSALIPNQISPSSSRDSGKPNVVAPPIANPKYYSQNSNAVYYTPKAIQDEIAKLNDPTFSNVYKVAQNVGQRNASIRQNIQSDYDNGLITKEVYQRRVNELMENMRLQYEKGFRPTLIKKGIIPNTPNKPTDIVHQNNQTQNSQPTPQQQNNNQNNNNQQQQKNQPFRPFGLQEYQRRIVGAGVSFLGSTLAGGMQNVMQTSGDESTAKTLGDVSRIFTTTASGGLMGGALGAGIGLAVGVTETALNRLADAINKTVDDVNKATERFAKAKAKDDIVTNIQDKQQYLKSVKNEDLDYFEKKIRDEQVKYDKAVNILGVKDDGSIDDDSFEKYQNKIEVQKRKVEELETKLANSYETVQVGNIASTKSTLSTEERDKTTTELELAKQKLTRMEQTAEKRNSALKDYSESAEKLNQYKEMQEKILEVRKQRKENYSDIIRTEDIEKSIKKLDFSELAEGINSADEAIRKLKDEIYELAKSGDTSYESAKRLEEIQKRLKSVEQERTELQKQSMLVQSIQSKREFERNTKATQTDLQSFLNRDENIKELWKSTTDVIKDGTDENAIINLSKAIDELNILKESLSDDEKKIVDEQIIKSQNLLQNQDLAESKKSEDNAESNYETTKRLVDAQNIQRTIAIKSLDDISTEEDSKQFKTKIFDIANDENTSTFSKIEQLESILDDSRMVAELAHKDKVELLKEASRADITEEQRKVYLETANEKDIEEKLQLNKVTEARTEIISQLQDRLSNLKAPDMQNVNSLASQGYMISKSDDNARLDMQMNYIREQTNLQREIRDQTRNLNTDATFSN